MNEHTQPMKTTKHLFSIVILTLGVVFRTQAQDPFTNGLVAYYPFNGNANDASGNGNNGTVFNAALTTDRLGKTSSAYSFNGVDNYIEVPSTSSLLFSNQLTISAWIKWVDFPGSQFSIVSKVYNDGWTGGFDFVAFRDLFAPGSDGIVLEGDFSEGTEVGYPHGWGQSPIARIPDWRHVVVVYSNQVQRFWADGTALTLVYNTAFGNIGQSSIPLRIGRRQSPNNNWFAGLIDDIRIYNRALSAAEVQQLYVYESSPRVNLIKAVKPSFSGLSLGTNYLLQVSGDLNNWTNQGSAFTATNTSMVYPQYWDVDGWGQLFFRLQVAP